MLDYRDGLTDETFVSLNTNRSVKCNNQNQSPKIDLDIGISEDDLDTLYPDEMSYRYVKKIFKSF